VSKVTHALCSVGAGDMVEVESVVEIPYYCKQSVHSSISHRIDAGPIATSNPPKSVLSALQSHRLILSLSIAQA